MGVTYNLEKPYLGHENGRRYWEGGGEGRDGIEGDDCTLLDAVNFALVFMQLSAVSGRPVVYPLRAFTRASTVSED